MTPRLPLILLLAFALTACKKKEADTTVPLPTPAAADAKPADDASGANASQPRTLFSAQQPTDGALPPVDNGAPTISDDPNVALDQMTMALRKYGAEKQRVPRSLEEVVAAGYLKSIPPAPPGQKYSFDPKMLKVILVKR